MCRRYSLSDAWKSFAKEAIKMQSGELHLFIRDLACLFPQNTLNPMRVKMILMAKKTTKLFILNAKDFNSTSHVRFMVLHNYRFSYSFLFNLVCKSFRTKIGSTFGPESKTILIQSTQITAIPTCKYSGMKFNHSLTWIEQIVDLKR